MYGAYRVGEGMPVMRTDSWHPCAPPPDRGMQPRACADVVRARVAGMWCMYVCMWGGAPQPLGLAPWPRPRICGLDEGPAAP